MKRDTTDLPSSDCNVIIDDKTVQVYVNNERQTFKLVSDKYYKTETEANQTPPSYVQCYTTMEMSQQPSQWDFITPIYHTLAIASAILIFYGAYRLILYPFFRKHV